MKDRTGPWIIFGARDKCYIAADSIGTTMMRTFSSRRFACLLATTAFLFVACDRDDDKDSTRKENRAMIIKLTSPALSEGGPIPTKHTCDGDDVSPALMWNGVPEGTKSFALICDDPDAPVGTWVHWVLYSLPATVNELPEKLPTTETLANGARQGVNDFKRVGYGGPCPPPGPAHRYF